MTPREFRSLFPEFSAPSWHAWNCIEDVVFGYEPDDVELVLRLTGRTALPPGPASEEWDIVGRGAGKSRAKGRRAAYVACGKEYRLAPGEHVYVGVFGPDKKQAQLTHRYIRGLLRSVPVLAAMIVRETTDSIELSNGVIIEVITANAAAPRGRSYALAIVEEAAFLPVDEHGADTDRELLRALRPALARVPGSLLDVASSPYAMRGEVHRASEQFYGKDDDHVLVVMADTLTMNPTFSRREIERAFKEDPVAARSEYGRDGVIEFRRDVADLFGPALAGVVDVGVRERAPERGRSAVAHFDGATGSGGDDAALAVAWTDDAGLGVLAAVRRWEPPFSPVAVVREAAALLARYGVEAVQVDRFAPGLFADLFAQSEIACAVAERDTSQTFLELLAYVNAGRVRVVDDDVLLAQLRGLERRTRGGGRDAVGHRPRGHDDVAAAAAGALVLAASADAHDDSMPLLFGPAYDAWWARRHGRSATAEAATPEERRDLLRVVEPWCAALDAADEQAVDRAYQAITEYLQRIERADTEAGRRVRWAFERVQRAVEEQVHARA